MKHIFTFLLFAPFALAAQSIDITVKGGVIGGSAYFKASDYFAAPKPQSDNNGGPIGPGFALGISAPLSGKFYIGTELGMLSFNTSVNQTLTDESVSRRYTGKNYNNYFYAALVPEYRFRQWGFVHAGVGIFRDVHNTFDGSANVGTSSEYVYGREFVRGYDLGYFVGGGFRPRLTKSLDFLLEARYTGLPTNKTGSGYLPVLGFHLVQVNIGLVYYLQQR